MHKRLLGVDSLLLPLANTKDTRVYGVTEFDSRKKPKEASAEELSLKGPSLEAVFGDTRRLAEKLRREVQWLSSRRDKNILSEPGKLHYFEAEKASKKLHSLLRSLSDGNAVDAENARETLKRTQKTISDVRKFKKKSE